MIDSGLKLWKRREGASGAIAPGMDSRMDVVFVRRNVEQ
jgi:hypothetical protein